MKTRAVVIALLLLAVGVTSWWRLSREPVTASSTPVLDIDPEPMQQSVTEITPISQNAASETTPSFVDSNASLTFSPTESPQLTPLLTNTLPRQEPATAVGGASQPEAATQVVDVSQTPFVSSNASFHLCVSNVHQIVWAANVWCVDYGELLLPDNFMLLSDQLASPLTLLCPADPLWSQKATANWAEFRPEWITYQLSPSTLARNPKARVNVSFKYVYCPVHKQWWLGDRPSPPGGWWVWWSLMNPGE
jgi:hypothetical protein